MGRSFYVSLWARSCNIFFKRKNISFAVLTFQVFSNFQANLLNILNRTDNRHKWVPDTETLQLQYHNGRNSIIFTLFQSIPIAFSLSVCSTVFCWWKDVEIRKWHRVQVKQPKLNSPLTHVTFSKQHKILLLNQCRFFSFQNDHMFFLIFLAISAFLSRDLG